LRRLQELRKLARTGESPGLGGGLSCELEYFGAVAHY
jgi:hypothetical protein